MIADWDATMAEAAYERPAHATQSKHHVTCFRAGSRSLVQSDRRRWTRARDARPGPSRAGPECLAARLLQIQSALGADVRKLPTSIDIIDSHRSHLPAMSEG
jgi:hypothetical protein